MTCEYFDKCFNAGHDILCEECGPDKIHKLTDPKEIKKAWVGYTHWCVAARKLQEEEDKQK